VTTPGPGGDKPGDGGDGDDPGKPRPRIPIANSTASTGSVTSTPPPIYVTVNVNGTNYGIDELQDNVTAAAVAGTLAAIQSDPTLIDHPYAVGS